MDNGSYIKIVQSEEHMRSPRGRRWEVAKDDPWYTDDENDIFAEDILDSFPYKQCPYRNYCGNCLAIGGFCLSVGEEHCRLKSEFHGGDVNGR